MATLSAKKVSDALKRAQNVGQVEEPVVIDGCEIVLRSLRSDEYEAIHNETSELEDIAYLTGFKREHLCRSIIEVNDVDLRTVDLIEVEVEEEDPKTHKPVLKPIKVEVQAFVRDYVIATWSREAIDVAFRKFNDVVAKAEKKAGEGVLFVVPDETSEEKYRRLLMEAKEVEGGVPVELAVKVREELGFTPKPVAADYTAAEERLAKLSSEGAPEATVQATVVTPETIPEAVPESPGEAPIRPQRVPVRATAPKPQEEVPQAPQARTARPAVPIPVPSDTPSPEELMRARQPLNQRATDVPLPVTPPAVLQANPILPATQASLRKAAEIAALEGVVPTPAVQGGTIIAPANPGGQEPMELSRQQPRINPGEAERIFEQPPTAGINPRFRSPPRL